MLKRILIGKIVSAHGIKGLVKVFPICEDTNLLNGPLFISEEGPETVDLKIKNSLGKFILAEIKGVHDRNKAESIKCSLFVSREALPNIDNDKEHYITDLIGLPVLNQEGQSIGTVLAIENFGASDLIEIQSISGKPFYIPFVSDYVIEVDVEFGKIIVANIDDFRDI